MARDYIPAEFWLLEAENADLRRRLAEMSLQVLSLREALAKCVIDRVTKPKPHTNEMLIEAAGR